MNTLFRSSANLSDVPQGATCTPLSTRCNVPPGTRFRRMRECAVTVDWEKQANHWEAEAKRLDLEADTLAAERDKWKAKARESGNRSHTWRLLYQDLLEKIGRKLDLKGETYE